MAGRSAELFWDEVAAEFQDNTLVFYELYNEPHTDTVRASLDYCTPSATGIWGSAPLH